MKASKLTARGLAYVLRAVGRKIAKAHRAKQTPHGKQTVKKLMAHGTSTNSLELSGDTKLFDRVARKWNVDYAFYQTEPGKYLLFFKSGQADAMTACFSEYSRKVLDKAKLEAQEQKYSAEMDKALSEYAELKAQAAELDPVELYATRQAICHAQEKKAEKQLENAMQEKLSPVMLLSAKQERSRLLKEDAEERQVRQMVMQRQAAQQKRSLRSVWKKNDFER